MDNKNNPPQSNLEVNVNPEKTPILYTDNVFMTTSENGVTLDFSQKLGPTNKIQIVARVGMSREHATKLMKELGKLLIMTDGQIQTNKKN